MKKIGLFIFCLCCSIAMHAEGLEVITSINNKSII